ncbi:hypothetical protein GCM10010399_37040 [Dactylosporangium fulvum]|uniref:Copper resistance protein D domain-containing protein n=1 Tax=Dactylosporangium fulvum TaxID=53359 RepID=A0ABY5VV44_9ACTN|nr:hypothetical protein [Dactylosporangium fulvum]UWP80929.1 hypothetical protein Dfulv_38245 [Dactylosporangium fulvum]
MALLVTVHLALVAVWAGAMGYSLLVVQPKAARFFTDDDQLEEFLMTLAHGNRWRVVALLAALILTAVAAHDRLPVLVLLPLYLCAAAIFANVSWRHWPARVFALPAERPAFRRSLRRQAWAMTVLAGAAFLTGLATSTGLL